MPGNTFYNKLNRICDDYCKFTTKNCNLIRKCLRCPLNDVFDMYNEVVRDRIDLVLQIDELHGYQLARSEET